MHMLFARYDKDASGEIDSTELLKMMKDTTRSARKRSGGWARNSAIDAALAEDRPAPRLRDVQEVMHAIGVDTSPGGKLCSNPAPFTISYFSLILFLTPGPFFSAPPPPSFHAFLFPSLYRRHDYS